MTNYSHPLEPLAFSQIDQLGAIDVWHLEAALGSEMNLKTSSMHYRYVAADILECMLSAGRVKRDGNGDPKKPEMGNFFYSRPKSGPFSAPEPLIPWFTPERPKA